MSTFGDNWQPIYINGIKRMATIGKVWENSFDGLFCADTDDLPLHRCSCHRLPAGSTDHMENGGTIRTSGNTYSLKGPK